MQLDRPLPEESYQQYHQLKGHLTLHLVTAEGVIGEHILNTHLWQKMLCALNVTGRPLQFTVSVYYGCNDISRAHKISNREHTPALYADTAYVLEYSGEH